MNEPLISIIIPVYNREDTIEETLTSVFSLNYENFEVIVVDGGSIDETVGKIKRFIEKYKNIKLVQGKGRLYASQGRNLGAKRAKGSILLFIDSDGKIQQDTIEKILKSFEKEKDAVAVIGLFSRNCKYKNFMSIYKNLYMHYTLVNLPKYAPITTGFMTAIKKEIFEKIQGYNENLRSVEDVELGERLISEDYKIYLNKKLQVEHLKKYFLWRLLKNDFERVIPWVRLLLKNFNLKKILKKGRYTDKSINLMLSVPVSYLVCLSVILNLVDGGITTKLFFFFFFLFFILLNIKFWSFLKENEGWKFAFISTFVTFVDMLAVGAGVFVGLLSSIERHRE
jgi:glycosyltransferase involved in cell wall biosynthesis